MKLPGDITSKFGKIKDETGTYNLTEGISFGEQIIHVFMTFFLTFCDILNDYRSLNICKMKNWKNINKSICQFVKHSLINNHFKFEVIYSDGFISAFR